MTPKNEYLGSFPFRKTMHTEERVTGTLIVTTNKKNWFAHFRIGHTHTGAEVILKASNSHPPFPHSKEEAIAQAKTRGFKMRSIPWIKK